MKGWSIGFIEAVERVLKRNVLVRCVVLVAGNGEVDGFVVEKPEWEFEPIQKCLDSG